MTPTRRQVLYGATAAAAAAALGMTSACSPRRMPVAFRYGSESKQQYGLLMLPEGRIRGTVVLIHGGSWLTLHPATEQVGEIQMALAKKGYATWAVEYRRLGSDGGFPNTFLDVAAGTDYLTKLDPSVEGVTTEDLNRNVILMGYSSGAQLAVWAASRREFTPGGLPKLKARAVLSLAGPLTMAALSGVIGTGVVRKIMGGTFDKVPDHYYQGDPVMLVPANMPVHVIHDTRDIYVPPASGETYCNVNRAAGGECTFTLVPGEHLQLGTPEGPAWPQVMAKIEELLG